MQGDLVYPPNDDSWMIADAWQADARPVLTLTPLDASGQFNNNLISSVVRSEGRIVKRAVYIALGIDMNGKKDVLGM